MKTINKNTMKLQLIIIAILFITFSCKAQTPIINQTTYEVDQEQDGMYLKDMDNILDRFVGTWKWESGNSSLEIILTKEDMVHNVPGKYYSDKIVGKYKYIENGVIKADNLTQIYSNSEFPIDGVFEQSNHNHLNIFFTDYVNHNLPTKKSVEFFC